MAVPNEFKATVEQYECGVCGAEFQAVKLPENPGLVLVCGVDHSHAGMRPKVGITEAIRAGIVIAPITHHNVMERTRPPVRTVEAMVGIWRSKQPALSRIGAQIAAVYTMALGLDPRLNEIACLEFGSKSTEKKIPTVMLTARGRRVLAARHCQGLLSVPPTIVDITTEEQKANYDAKPDDYVAVAWGRRTGDPDQDPVTGLAFARITVGVYTKNEFQRDTQRSTPAAKEPQNQARRRAERRWYEVFLPEAEERAREAWGAALHDMKIDEAQGVIEAEFTLLAEDAPAALPAPSEEARPDRTRPTTQRAAAPRQDEPPYTAYFRIAREEKGLKPDEALARLQVNDWNGWVELGGTLEQALKKLREG